MLIKATILTKHLINKDGCDFVFDLQQLINNTTLPIDVSANNRNQVNNVIGKCIDLNIEGNYLIATLDLLDDEYLCYVPSVNSLTNELVSITAVNIGSVVLDKSRQAKPKSTN